MPRSNGGVKIESRFRDLYLSRRAKLIREAPLGQAIGRQEQKLAELTDCHELSGDLDLAATLSRSTQRQQTVNVTTCNSLERFPALLDGLAQDQLLEDRVDSHKAGNGN